MKKLLSLLIALLLCFSLSACKGNQSNKGPLIQTDTEEEENDTTVVEEVPQIGSTPLLYKVTDSDGDIVWLFGSIHVGREDLYPLPEYVTEAFNGSESLAVELDIVAFEKDLNGQMKAVSSLVYTDGTTISDHISEENYTEAVTILEENDMYNSLYDRYCPMMWTSLIDSINYDNAKVDPSLGIDRHLIEAAYDTDKEIINIESAEYQYRLMADFSPELQEYILETTVEQYYSDTTPADINQLVDIWAEGNEAALSQYLDETDEFDSDLYELYEEYNTAMLVKRNLLMTKYAENALELGEEVFICVGAAHVVGEGAMADLLTKRGYTVEIIAE